MPRRLIIPLLLSAGIVCHAADPAPSSKPGPWNLSLFMDQQSYGSGSESFTLPYPSPSPFGSSYSASQGMAYGLRLGYTVAETGPLAWEISGAYQPGSTGSLDVTVQWGSSLTPLAPDYRHSFTALGFMASLDLPVSVGLGLDYRAESATMSPANHFSGTSSASISGGSASFSRVWARASLAYHWNAAKGKPTLGLEAAKPLTSTPGITNTSSQDDVARALAPTGSFGLVFGLRF